jgi:hypothetical protein
VAHLGPRARLPAAVDAQHVGGPAFDSRDLFKSGYPRHPQIYDMSIFPVTSRSCLHHQCRRHGGPHPGLMLLRIGIRCALAPYRQLKALKDSDQSAASASISPIETVFPTETPLQLRPRRLRPPPLDALRVLLEP